MTCGFDLDHYGEILGAASAGGYTFAFFDRPPEPGTVILRHDVDLSLDAALAMAELEAAAGASATYFLMTRSEFYNLDSASGEAALERLRGLGHRVGLHAVWPHVDRDDRFDAVLAWHNPDPEYMRDPVDSFVNAMETPWADVYRSDSNQHWRQGCPHEELAAGSFERLQLLTHPEIWAYPGTTMRETMLAMLDSERERRLDQLAADRIDLS
jgi:catechol 2,3-dioxygenase-like lactoylglutathione lyase family enzyme